VITLSFGYCI